MTIDWNAVTGIGTVAVAVSAVSIAVWSDWRSQTRLKSEREHSEKQLTEERTRSDEEIKEERRLSQEREQFAEASQVEVALIIPRAGDAESDQAPTLKLTVRNHGKYAITDIRAWAGLKLRKGYSLHPFGEPRQEQRWDGLDLDSQYTEPAPGARPDWLPPWDVRLVFEADPPGPFSSEMGVLAGYPIVLWTDRWGNSWEHKRGKLRQVNSSDELSFDTKEFLDFGSYPWPGVYRDQPQPRQAPEGPDRA